MLTLKTVSIYAIQIPAVPFVFPAVKKFSQQEKEGDGLHLCVFRDCEHLFYLTVRGKDYARFFFEFY
jgi:hypothetical protein